MEKKLYHERTINVPGFTLAVKVWNENAKVRALCLHGKMDNAASFDFIAPLLPDIQIVALDFPGNGHSSWYPEGVLPHWKTDAFLLLHLSHALGWEEYTIIGHSLGALMATQVAMMQNVQVKKLVFLDILGPTVNFITQRLDYLPGDVQLYLHYQNKKRSVFKDQDAAIKDRMKIGNLSYEAARALVIRGTTKCPDGWQWTFDPRLGCVSSTVPYEDELQAMFKAVTVPVCLIKAKHGVQYPKEVFSARVNSFKDLTLHEVDGGHHVHMEQPEPIARLINEFIL